VRAGSWPTSQSRRAEPASARRPYKMADERVQEGGARLGEEAV
jgi:hypothetical protein